MPQVKNHQNTKKGSLTQEPLFFYFFKDTSLFLQHGALNFRPREWVTGGENGIKSNYI
jgi:hypothetical protein